MIAYGVRELVMNLNVPHMQQVQAIVLSISAGYVYCMEELDALIIVCN